MLLQDCISQTRPLLLMEPSTLIQHLCRGESIKFPQDANSLEYARKLDRQESLRSYRDQFRIPTKRSLKRKAVTRHIIENRTLTRNGNYEVANGTKASNGVNGEHSDNEIDPSCIYFCGNSLGCQPKLVSEYLSTHLQTWADHGVNGHFTDLDESPLTAWQDMAESCARKSAPIVGADTSEIVIMNTLTANLHLLMASFYQPAGKRHKIICEWKPFPSDFVSLFEIL
jgi:kynureninase